ncbi:MAG: hypothetical protein ACOCQ4_03630 [bacterium]
MIKRNSCSLKLVFGLIPDFIASLLFLLSKSSDRTLFSFIFTKQNQSVQIINPAGVFRRTAVTNKLRCVDGKLKSNESRTKNEESKYVSIN